MGCNQPKADCGKILEEKRRGFSAPKWEGKTKKRKKGQMSQRDLSASCIYGLCSIHADRNYKRNKNSLGTSEEWDEMMMLLLRCDCDIVVVQAKRMSARSRF